MGNGQPCGGDSPCKLRAGNRRVRGGRFGGRLSHPASRETTGGDWRVRGATPAGGACPDTGESLAAGTESIERCIASGKKRGDSRTPVEKRNCVATEYGEEPGSKAAKAVMISHSRLLKNRFHADDAATPCSLHMLLIPAVAPRLICPTTRNNGACRGPRLLTPTSHKRACRGPRLPTPTSHKRACRGPRLPTPTSHKRACRGPRLRRVFPQPVRPMKYAVGRDLTRYLPEHS
jgi:hypothetical protein